MSVTIYHNPRCSKSREGVKILDEMGINFTTRLYMTDVPTIKELKDVISKLGITPEQLLRKKEAIYKELYQNKKMTDDDILNAMIEHPNLIERPIVLNNNKAIIGRPPSLIEQIF